MARLTLTARPIPKEDNGACGRIIADLYRINRINDGYIITVS
ncbi:hypothetical protein [Streptomyces sp. NPDC046821]